MAGSDSLDALPPQRCFGTVDPATVESMNHTPTDLWFQRDPSSPVHFTSSRLANEVMPLINIRRHRNIEEADHHLVVSLAAPGHCFFRIGIVRIVPRVVEPGDSLEPRAGFEEPWLGQPVAQLPVEVVVH